MSYSPRLAVGLPDQARDAGLTVDPNRNAQRSALAVFLKTKITLTTISKALFGQFSENCFAGRKKNGLHCKPFIKKQRTKLLVPVAFGSAICYTNGVYTTAERK